MADIVIHSEAGQFPAVELQPGNTLVVKLAGTDALIILNVPLYDSLPWCDVYGNDGKVNRLFTFRLNTLPEPKAE